MSIDHVSVGVTNMKRSKAFYDAALAPLGMAPVYPVEINGQLVGVGYGVPNKPSFWIQLPINGQAASMGNGVHIAFRAEKREAVDAFFLAALEQGGVANALLCRKFQRRYSLAQPTRYVAEFEKVLASLASTKAARDLEISGAMLQWLAWLMNELHPPMDRALIEERGVVDKILLAETWADTRLGEVITLTEWAKAVGLNAVYFGRVFKRETGLRPMDWLNQRRLQLACQQLASTRQTISAISESCGFASPFYFSRVFRKHFGQSPSPRCSDCLCVHRCSRSRCRVFHHAPWRRGS